MVQKEWSAMTPDEKREERFRRWLNPVGVKFNDADLLGIPFRVTVSPRTLEKNGVELKLRAKKEAEIVPAFVVREPK